MSNWKTILSWQGTDIPLSGIKKDGIKHQILSLWKDDQDGIVFSKQVASLGYRFQYFTQLQLDNYIERIGRGEYKLTLKGKQALSQLGFYSGNSSYIPHPTWEQD